MCGRINSLRAMSKRPLSPEEIAIAAKLKARIREIPGMTEEKVGAEVGVSQGQVSHWTGGRLPVPAIRAAKLASVLGFDDPGDISIAYRDAYQGEAGRTAAPSHSHSARLDPRIFRLVARAMQDAHKELGRAYNVADSADLFVELYERVRTHGLTTADVVWLATRLNVA